MYRLIITLKSDLCTADGDGYGTAIDTDICRDKDGFPFIPARRIKGCLKEAAKLIGCEQSLIDRIFGTSGAEKGCALRISDAVIMDKGEYPELLSQNKIRANHITDAFTYVRASTAIENDTAKENSLRFMRVVKHYSPVDDEPLKFTAPLSIPDELSDEFSKICRALRNIGYKRNRGYGAVSCALEKTDKQYGVLPAFTFKAGKNYTIRYAVELTDDVMIPSGNSTETMDYIPGGSVLGFFANEYLRSNEADDTFTQLFLMDKVRFSNLLISNNEGDVFFPAPMIIGKTKDEKAPINILTRDSLQERTDDKIIKPLKGGYTDFSMQLKKSLTSTVYHNSVHPDNGDKTLYTQTALTKGQIFCGEITGDGSLLEKVYCLMQCGEIRVGRSKTAQYSTCRIITESVKPSESYTDTVSVKVDDVFAAIAVSDLLIPDGKCGYSPDITAIESAVQNAFGFSERFDKGLNYHYSAVKRKVVRGFNSQWKLSKTPLNVAAAGTVLVFKAKEQHSLPRYVDIGDKIGEGFGRVMIIKSDDLYYVEKATSETCTSVTDKEKLRLCAIKFACSHPLEIHKTQVGRATLMAKQANNYDMFIAEVDRIADDTTREELLKFLKKADIKSQGDNWREYTILILTLAKYIKKGESNNE